MLWLIVVVLSVSLVLMIVFWLAYDALVVVPARAKDISRQYPPMRVEAKPLRDMTLRALKTSKEREQYVDLAADAFLNSPSYRYIMASLSEKERKLDAIKYLLLRNFISVSKLAPTAALGLFHQSSLKCAFTLKPKAADVSLPTLIRLGILTLPLRYGWQCFTRLLDAIGAFDEEEKRAVARALKKAGQKEDHYYHLERMVVDPRFHRQGLGSAALGYALKNLCDTVPAPCALATQEPSNVRFYQRLGFSVVDQFQALGGNNFVMIRFSQSSPIS